MQIIAMLTMLIDHIGYIFFPKEEMWRIIGRIAFPIYAYYIVQGFIHTSSRWRYLWRLVALAGISQVPYVLAFDTSDLNVICTLALCLGVLMLHARFGWLGLAVGLVCGIVLLEWLEFNYGAYGLLLVLIYRYLDRKWWVVAHFALNLLSIGYGDGWLLQHFSILATVLMAYKDQLFAEFKLDRRVHSWVWRGFYPVHLALLAFVAAWLS